MFADRVQADLALLLFDLHLGQFAGEWRLTTRLLACRNWDGATLLRASLAARVGFMSIAGILRHISGDLFQALIRHMLSVIIIAAECEESLLDHFCRVKLLRGVALGLGSALVGALNFMLDAGCEMNKTWLRLVEVWSVEFDHFGFLFNAGVIGSICTITRALGPPGKNLVDRRVIPSLIIFEADGSPVLNSLQLFDVLRISHVHLALDDAFCPHHIALEFLSLVLRNLLDYVVHALLMSSHVDTYVQAFCIGDNHLFDDLLFGRVLCKLFPRFLGSLELVGIRREIGQGFFVQHFFVVYVHCGQGGRFSVFLEGAVDDYFGRLLEFNTSDRRQHTHTRKHGHALTRRLCECGVDKWLRRLPCLFWGMILCLSLCTRLHSMIFILFV